MTATQRVVAIIGAGGALGAAVSQRIAGEPATDLMLSDVSAASLEATVAGVASAGGAVETMLADVSDYDQVEAVITRAVERFGRLDVLISNAGILSPNGRIHNLRTEDWERSFRVNLLGAANGIRAAVGVMRPQHSRLHHPDRVGLGPDRLVARGALLRHQGGRDSAGQGRRRRIRP